VGRLEPIPDDEATGGEGCEMNYDAPIFENMAAHMKTTIEISDALFNATKEHAQQSQTTMNALIEEGLRRVLSDSQARAQTAFKLKDASVRGEQVLISDPRQWQQMEEDHVAARVTRPLA
jgi:hypothetical protein